MKKLINLISEEVTKAFVSAGSVSYTHLLTSVKDKICPLEVKSGNYRTHKSLDAFCNKFSNRIGSKYVVPVSYTHLALKNLLLRYSCL